MKALILWLLCIGVAGCATPFVPRCEFPKPAIVEVDEAHYFVFDVHGMVAFAKVTKDIAAGLCVIRNGTGI